MPGAKGNDGCNNVTSTAAIRRRSPATWSNGRVVLVGDAAGVSLFGDGSSLAMTGAFTLANLFVPATRVGIAVRNAAVHVMPLAVKIRETAFPSLVFRVRP